MAKTILDTHAIMEIVQMQAPCLLLDRAEVDVDGRTVQAVKDVSAEEPAFAGHFPGHPILPGVMQVEAMRQAALLLAAAMPGHADKTFVSEMSRTKFRKPVQPGARMQIAANVLEETDSGISFAATATVDDQLTSECRLTLSPPPTAPPPRVAEAMPADPAFRALSTAGIMDEIPHRAPFLFIDRMIHLPQEGDACQDIISIKHITAADLYLAPTGTGSGPVPVPPPFLVEVAAQTGCVYLLGLPQNAGKIGYFLSIDQAEYHRPVHVGDVLVTHIRILNLRGTFGKCEGRVSVNGELVGRSDVKFAFVEV